MAAFAAWLLGFSKSFLTWLYNHAIDLIQGAIDGFASFCLVVVGMFPSGPSLPSSGIASPIGPAWDMLLSALNWLFPLQFFVQCMGFASAAILAYVVIAPLARWAKLLT